MFKLHLLRYPTLLAAILLVGCSPTKNASSNKTPAPGTKPRPDYSLLEKALYIAGTDTLPYRILFPENYDRKKNYPLVLFLHGAGEKGNDNESQLVHGASLFLNPENRKAYPCIVLFPQCPVASYWSSGKFDRTKDPVVRTFDYEYDLTMSLRRAMELTRQVIRNESVDKKRVYVTGLSMGGMGTFEAIGRYQNLFAAAAPICGGGDVKAFNEKTDNIPCWIFHGSADNIVSVEYSREMYARLQELHCDVKYTEYPGAGHNSWDNAFAEPDFLKWMFSKKR